MAKPGPRRITERYPFEPLAAAMGLTPAQAARRLGLSGSTEQAARQRGLTPHTADRLAIAADLHPANVWPEWLEGPRPDDPTKESAPCA